MRFYMASSSLQYIGLTGRSGLLLSPPGRVIGNPQQVVCGNLKNVPIDQLLPAGFLSNLCGALRGLELKAFRTGAQLGGQPALTLLGENSHSSHSAP